ncbi:MAG: 2-oxo acid dehydrogenase subunit E2 [Candidatus Hydrogenedentes bacterium]|nr:2-oxo acid dehydrogenase subunit E2 [Candidatus Hydrogenedentota bacterium]
MATEFKLPDLGEGIDSGTVTAVLVSEGDTIAEDDSVIEIETGKAVVEVPSTVGGKVTAIKVKEGDTLKIGAVICTVDGAAGGKAAKKQDKAPKPEEPRIEEEEPEAEAAEEVEAGTEEVEEDTKPAREQAKEHRREAVQTKAEKSASKTADKRSDTSARRASTGPVPASPSVRRLAREIGVDIYAVDGSGPGGRISELDVKEYARDMNIDVRGVAVRGHAAQSMALPDFTRWGEVERQELSSVRRRITENLSYAWATIPHVTQFDEADVTSLEQLRKDYGKEVEAAGGKLTMTAILMKIVAGALRKFPIVNTSIDIEHDELVYKRYYNIGVAVDTDRGLLVPVVRDVDKKSLTEISVELSQIAERARNRKTSLEEMQGATFTVSNLGGIGGTGFTPIINPPEVGILGVSRSRVQPVFNGSSFEPRTVLPLALSYDHRVVDGADGARFLRFVCRALEQPLLLSLE